MPDVVADDLIPEVDDQRLHRVREASRSAVRIPVPHGVTDRDEDQQQQDRGYQKKDPVLRRGEVELQRTDVERLPLRQVPHPPASEDLELDLLAVAEVVHEPLPEVGRGILLESHVSSSLSRQL